MNVYSRHIPNFCAPAGTKSIVKADTEMNLVKQEEEAKEFPTSQIIHQISGILVAASIGDRDIRGRCSGDYPMEFRKIYYTTHE